MRIPASDISRRLGGRQTLWYRSSRTRDVPKGLPEDGSHLEIMVNRMSTVDVGVRPRTDRVEEVLGRWRVVREGYLRGRGWSFRPGRAPTSLSLTVRRIVFASSPPDESDNFLKTELTIFIFPRLSAA